LNVFLYNIFLWLYGVAIHISSLFDPKAKKWVTGRRKIFQRLQSSIPAGQKTIWMHCASLGEFEQGRPVLEKLRGQYPNHKILLTFFSPSGYEVQKDYKGADWVFYLPMDGPVTAKRFLEIVHPSLVIFVKYEFWYYYLKKIKYRSIPLVLISALFRPDMSFFKWYGGLQRKILSRFDQLFVQNESSWQLLDKIGLGGISMVSGDTRFDRVVEIAATSRSLPVIEKFIGASKCLVAGSTWKNDEAMLKETIDYLYFNEIKLIIAPHEVDTAHIKELQQSFPGSWLYSTLKANEGDHEANVLIIDNIGMLSTLYKYSWCCYVGGGLDRSGVHNVLEAAVYHKPVFFGPYYEKYREAIGLVASKGAFPVQDKNELIALLNQLLLNPAFYGETGEKAGQFVKNNTGAVEKIMNYIQEKRLLTN
jgi:3-deoxy-D-manno-octulosonic-acid transferase